MNLTKVIVWALLGGVTIISIGIVGVFAAYFLQLNPDSLWNDLIGVELILAMIVIPIVYCVIWWLLWDAEWFDRTYRP